MNITGEVKASSPHQERVLEFFQALGDPLALRAVFAPDVTWTVWGHSPLAGVYEGVDAVVDGFHCRAAELFESDFPGVLELINLIGTESVVGAEFNYRTRTAIGRDYHNHYVEVFDIGPAGEIQHVREYMDSAHFGWACFGS